MRSLSRLLIGAAFVLLGWVLSSSTVAQADDRGLLGAVTSAAGLPAPAEPAAVVVTDVVEAVPATTSSVTATVEDVAAASPVAPVVDEPVSATTSSVDAVAATASEQVLAPVADAVVATEQAVGEVPAPTAPVAPVPTLAVPAPTADGPGLGAAPVEPALGALRAEESERSSLGGAHDVAAGSQVAPLFGAVQRKAEREPPVAPSDREPVVPWPSWHLGSMTPTSAPTLPLTLSIAVLGTALLLIRPERRCSAARLGRQALAVGPSLDPGSRPG
ncbi:hypothetical protein ACK8HX_03370 [Oryzobacter sp. R7]|uniref:hypothetical protein n=1 Tax=Oryzobacter faecalis TaxID=3388656 RepID=UPI00398D17A1